MHWARGGPEPVDTRYSIPWLERRFGVAVIASLVVHAAAMSISFPAPRALLAEALPVLQVSLREPVPPPAVSPAPPAPAPAPPLQKRARSDARTHGPAPVARTSEPLAPSPARNVEEERVPAPVEEAAAASPAAPPQWPAAAAQNPASRAPSSPLLSNYGLTIAEVLARYKEYPPLAQMQGWEGSVTMQLRVAATGRLLQAEVHRSSGHGVLDRQALAMAAKAARFPPPPEGLDDREVEVLVPVVFRLER
jgi:periplasmic protein TonB